MNLSNVNLLALQSAYMQQDPTTQALCASLTPQFKLLAGNVKFSLIYSRIDYLQEVLLDEQAWQMHIDWYDATASIDVKRKLIKNSDKVHMYLGTPYAIEQVVNDYFGDGYVEEWFEYDGEPFYFRVVTSNPAVTGEQATQFTQAIEKVKNLRSRLEQVIVSMTGQMDEYFGFVLQTGDFYNVEQVVV